MQTANAGRDPGHMRWRPDGLRKAAPIVFGMALLLVSAMAAPPGSVQSNAALGVNTSFGAASTTSGTTLLATPTTATASGDLLVATIEVRGVSTLNTVTGVGDSASDAWVMAVRRTHSGLQDAEIWYAAGANALTSTGSVTVTVSSTSSIAMTVLDVGGVSAAALDVTASAAGRSTAGSTGTTSTTGQASEITIAEVGWNTKVTPSPVTTGYTQTPTEQSHVSGHATGQQAAWKLLTTIGRQNYKATLSTIVNWIGAIVTFRLTTPPPPTPTPTLSPSPSPTAGTTPIKHIVLFYQENHSFDNVLGALCAANTRKTPCDGTTTGKLPAARPSRSAAP